MAESQKQHAEVTDQKELKVRNTLQAKLVEYMSIQLAKFAKNTESTAKYGIQNDEGEKIELSKMEALEELAGKCINGPFRVWFEGAKQIIDFQGEMPQLFDRKNHDLMELEALFSLVFGTTDVLPLLRANAKIPGVRESIMKAVGITLDLPN